MDKNLSKKIKDLANIVPGYSFRGAIKPVSNGAVSVVQASNISQGNIYLNPEDLKRIDDYPINSNSYLEDGDVLISARGGSYSGFKSLVYKKEDWFQKIIASSSVYILRIKNKEEIIPEFISDYLNSFLGQNELAKITEGSSVRTILRKHLEDIEIPVLNMKDQEKKVGLNNTINEIKNNYTKKIELLESIKTGVLLELINK